MGSTTLDLVDGGPGRTGGPPLYAARALRAAPAGGAVLTRLAPADERLLEPVRDAGLPLVWVPADATPVFRIENRAGERELAIDRLCGPWRPADLDTAAALLAGAAWVLAGALWRGELPAGTLRAMRDGRRLCLDGHGLVRPARTGPVVLDGAYDRGMLAHVDALHLSRVEATALGLRLDAASLGSLGVPEVVVTLGAEGAVVAARGRCARVHAEPLDGIDPTGAGDTYTAAYLAARAEGAEPVEAARAATSLTRSLLAAR